MSSFHNKICKEEYQNWLAAGYAFCLMSEGIRPYITKKMENLYKTLQTLPPCACIYDIARKKNPWHDMTCCAWARTLQGLHQGNNPKWKQSYSNKWSDSRIGCWEISKLFMSDLGTQKLAVVDAESTDVTGLVNILCWCKQFDTLRPYAEQVRNDRNTKWAHAPNLEISLADKHSAIENIINLLNAIWQISKDDDILNALKQIKQINTHFDVENKERKIILDFVYETKNALDDVTMRLSQFESTRSKDRKNVEGLEKRLASYEERLRTSSQKIQTMTEASWPLSVWLVVVQAIHELRKRSSSLLIVLVLIVSCVQLDPDKYDEKCPDENHPLRFNVKEFNFTRPLNTAREGFVGRQWLFKDVMSKLKNPNTSTVLIVGDPGSGKSAIAAQLICSRNTEPSKINHVIAYHVCQHYNKETQEPGRFIRNLVDLIARRLPEYENIIVNMSLTDRLRRHDCEGYPFECFEEAIVIPLKAVMKTKERDRNNYYIVLDALDECSASQGGPVSSIVDLVKSKAPRLPKNIKIIATTRNDTSFIGELKSFAEVVAIDPSDSRNEEDIAFYIDSVPDRRFNFINKILKYFSFRSSELHMKESEDLVKMGQGNFLFVKLLAQYQQSNPGYTVTPKTIGQVYEGYFRRSYPTRESFLKVRSVLEILVSVLQPLRKEDVFYILNLQKNDLVYQYFHQDLNTLSHFLRSGDNNTLSLFHKSLVEWLTSEENRGNFFVQKREGHRKLIPYYIELIKNSDTNNRDVRKLILDLAQHIASGDVFDKYVEDFKNIFSALMKKSVFDTGNTSFLHLAATINNTFVIKLFLPFFKNNVDCIDSKGFTPAFTSAKRGFLDNVKLLVSLGANVNHKTNPPPPLPYYRGFEDPVVVSKREFWYYTMLHVASQQGYFDVVEFLLENNATIFEKNGVGLTALQLAAENGHLETAQLLHSGGAVVDQLALHHAALNGHRNVVEFLLSKGVTDDCMRCDGSFYWLGGDQRYQSLWIGLEPDQNIDLSRIINVDKDAKYALYDDQSLLYCETALHVAVAKGHLDVTRVLLKHSVLSFNCLDYSGRTPLHVAASTNNPEVMSVLIAAGARLNSKCSFLQDIPLRDRRDSMYIIKRYKYLSFKEEIDYFTDVCSCDHTALDVAAMFGHVESAQFLLQQDGSLARKRDCNGASIIHIAACYGRHHFINWIINFIRDVDINSRSANGSTPLHSAAHCGNYEEVKQLISDGANTRVLDRNNMTVLHYTMIDLDHSNWEGSISSFKITSDYSEYEMYFKNDQVTVWKFKRMTHFLFVHSFKEAGHILLLPEVVKIDAKCRTQEELLRYDKNFYFNAKDSQGRTALELAVVNGLKCSCVVLLKNTIPKTLQDLVQRRDVWKGIFSEAYFKKTECEKQRILSTIVNFFNHLFKGNKCYGERRNCLSSNIILLAYLQNRIRDEMIETWLLHVGVEVNITCNTHFMESELHLLSFWPPTNYKDNFFFTKQCKRCSFGPLTKALQQHRLGFEVLNQCRDLEGYTPLHRAAQGGNIVAIKQFLHWGADVKATSTDWNQTALELAVSYSGKREDINKVDIDNELASNVSILLLESSPHVKIICDGSATNLTIYHVAAYRGIVGLVKKLLEDRDRLGLEVNCPDINRITPLYLAKLRNRLLQDSKENPWGEIIELIESHGGKLVFPLSVEAEHHILYRHLYKNILLYNTNKEHYEYMLALYKDKRSIDSCLRKNVIKSQIQHNDESFSKILETMVKLEREVILLARAHGNDKIGLLLYSILSDIDFTFIQFMSNVNKKSSTLKETNPPDFNKENREKYLDKDILQDYRLSVENNKRNMEMSRQSLSRCHQLLSYHKGKFQSMDVFVGKIEDILNTIDRMAIKIEIKEHVRKEIHRYHKSSFCDRFLISLNMTLVCFEAHSLYSSAREMSFEITEILASDFLQSRLKLTAFPVGGYFNRNLKTLVYGTRYLLDLFLDRKTKYEYLKLLTIGKTPATRLFYKKGKPENIENLERSIASNIDEIEQIRRDIVQEVMTKNNTKHEKLSY